MKTHHLLLVLPLLLASCGSDGGNKTTASTPAPRKKLSERMNEEGGYKQDANGKWVPRSDKRSPYESQGASQYAQKDYKKQEYKAGDYAKKSWLGGKEYDRKAYAGNTDASRFQKASDLGGKGARETETNFKTPDAYKTTGYATTTARESGNKQLAKSSNDMIENRRQDYVQPEIIDWREQRSMSMDRSKGILGR
ncbi:MAG: hypothetical protein EOP88_19290 [Verrucomicrobiaceae bacterium]|nr:MAG: hypothetical protein EOP88_19290 [Verrucomicrobiaceae bacterium]